MARSGRGDKTARLAHRQIVLFHQLGHTLLAASNTSSLQVSVDAGTAIAPFVMCKNLADLLHQKFLLPGTLADGPLLPSVESAGCDIQHPQQNSRVELALMLLNELITHLPRHRPGCEKMLMAFFKISRS